MSINVCPLCGGSVVRQGGYIKCEYCRHKWEQRSEIDPHVVERANAWQYLRKGEFEEALELFNHLLAFDKKDFEAYWGRALTLNGIVYVDDILKNKKVPTFNNMSEADFLLHEDVKSAINLAPKEIADEYQYQAEIIEALRKEWMEKARKEPPYDVFISYKDSDKERGIERTSDSITAQDLYTHLIKKGYNVFYSHESLRDKVSEHYEPYIYNAIKTAKVMIVYGEKAEYFNATWIKNEWTRFIRLIERGEKDKKGLVVVYNKGVNPYDIPKKLTGGRQAIDYSIPSNFAYLLNHIEKIIKLSKKIVHLDKIEIKGGQIAKKATSLEVNAIQTREIGSVSPTQTNITELQMLSLADTYIKMEQWADADSLIEGILSNNPNSAEALWKKILIEKRVKTSESLISKITEFTKKDFDFIDKLLSCATKEKAAEVLDLLYSGINNYDDTFICEILKVILPYQYDNRSKQIENAFELAITNTKYQTFNLLLTTLESGEVDKYVEYNKRYVSATAIVEEKRECINRILSVDESNLEALKTLLYIQLEAKEEQKNILATFESLLKYSTNVNNEIKVALIWLTNNVNNDNDFVLIKEVLRYVVGELSSIKEELLTLLWKMIELEFFDNAEYLAKLLLSFDPSNAEVYWSICLIKLGVKNEKQILTSNLPLKSIPEYTKYLALVDESRRMEVIQLAKEQERAIYEREEKERLEKEKNDRVLNRHKKGKQLSSNIRKHFKKVIAVILVIIACICVTNSVSYIKKISSLDTNDFVFELTEDGNSYKIVGVNTVKSSMSIPAYYKNKPVVAIGDRAFLGCTELTTITLPYYITSIGDSAFSWCTSLKTIELPNRVLSIGENAFHNCESLMNIKIPNSVTSIGFSAFSGCNKLSSITLPFVGKTKNSKDIPHLGYIFGAYDFLQNANYIPKALKTVIVNGECIIGTNAFYESEHLTNVVLGTNVSVIEEYAFSGCINLNSVIFLDTTNWYVDFYVSNTEIDVNNDSQNAIRLTSSYMNYYWYKV